MSTFMALAGTRCLWDLNSQHHSLVKHFQETDFYGVAIWSKDFQSGFMPIASIVTRNSVIYISQSVSTYISVSRCDLWCTLDILIFLFYTWTFWVAFAISSFSTLLNNDFGWSLSFGVHVATARNWTAPTTINM